MMNYYSRARASKHESCIKIRTISPWVDISKEYLRTFYVDYVTQNKLFRSYMHLLVGRDVVIVIGA